MNTHLHSLLLTATICIPLSGQGEIRYEDFGGAQERALGMQLGRLSVPIRHEEPAGDQIELAFIRVPCLGKPTGAPILYLSGGPGDSGTAARNFYPELWKQLLQTGDLILLDQRGTGMSKPSIDYRYPGKVSADWMASRESMLDSLIHLSESSVNHFNTEGIDFAAFNCMQSVGDIDFLRRALDLEKMRILAFSYGTHLALQYLREHSQHVERAVLCGVEGPDHTRKLPSTAEDILAEYSALAAADPQFADEQSLLEAIEDVLGKAEEQALRLPLQGAAGGRSEALFGKTAIQVSIAFNLGNRQRALDYPRIFFAASDGEYGPLAGFLSRLHGMTAAVRGALWVGDTSSSASDSRYVRILAEAEAGLLEGASNFPFPEIHQAWPVEDLGEDYRSPVHSEAQSLFLSGTLDANTPPEQSREVMSGFPNARLIVVEQGGHQDYLQQRAVISVIHAYLAGEEIDADRIELPPLRFSPKGS